jgi:predicted RecA/RadA family phage recombinase
MYDTELKPGEFTGELTATGAIEAGSLVAVATSIVAAPETVIAATEDAVILGVAQNDAAIGETVICRRGTYPLHIEDGDTLVPGAKVYATDNETVGDTAVVDASIPAGVFLGLDPDGKALVDVTLATAV